MSKTACFIIAVVLLARLLLRKVPKAISYALWSVVFIRLLCPFSFSLPFYGIPEKAYEPIATIQDAPAETSNHTEVQSEQVIAHVPAEKDKPFLQRALPVASGIWFVGLIGMLLYGFGTYWNLKRKLVGSVPYEKNIDWVDYLETPFVMGVIHPKIYLPSTLENQELTYILAHEEHHIKRRDYLTKPIAFFALCLHWFNPLVWLSFFLFCEDMEMSCDEAVIRKLGENVRTSYAESLLSTATGRHILTATPLAFGEGDTKGRIRNMKNWKKPVLWIVILAVVACILLGAFLLTNHKESKANPEGMIDTAQVIESLDAQLIVANYMQEGRKTTDGELLVWDETSITEITVQDQPCYAMALCFSENTDHCYGTFAVSKDGKTVYQENPDADTEDVRWQEISENAPSIGPVTEPIALTEDSANQCMIQILESFLVQEDGTVSFSVPTPLPTSNEKMLR